MKKADEKRIAALERKFVDIEQAKCHHPRVNVKVRLKPLHDSYGYPSSGYGITFEPKWESFVTCTDCGRELSVESTSVRVGCNEEE